MRQLLSVLIVLMAVPAFAQQPAPSCQEQLLIKTSHDQLLVEKRAETENQLAYKSAEASVLQYKVQLLTKENAELKAKIKSLEPPPAEKPAAEKSPE